MKIKTNYHTHTPLCHHAKGDEREYIENAIKAGITTLGFSDHAPWPYKDGFKSRVRMETCDLPGYFDKLTKLRDEYASKIDIHIGLETEYFPEMFPELLDTLADYPCEYLLLGHHFLHDERLGIYVGDPFDSEKQLEEYTDEVVAAIETGEYLYVAHPDIANFTGDESFYLGQARRICRAAKNADMPLEINMVGMRGLRWYPRGLFFEAAAEEGNSVIIGCDAHNPGVFLDEDTLTAEQDCIDFAESFGLTLADRLF